MANELFDPGREGIADDTISLPTGVIKAALVRGYTKNNAHKFVSDLTGAGGELVGTPATLTGKTYTAGVFDAADVAFTAVASGAAITGILIYQASAVTGGADVAATAQRLVGWYDTATNLPVTPNGGDLAIAWDNTADKKIFKL